MLAIELLEGFLEEEFCDGQAARFAGWRASWLISACWGVGQQWLAPLVADEKLMLV